MNSWGKNDPVEIPLPAVPFLSKLTCMKSFHFPEPAAHPRSPARPLKSSVSEEVLEQARAAVREFPGCFWFRHPESFIENVDDVRIVVENLREYGGHRAWHVAQRLQKCL